MTTEQFSIEILDEMNLTDKELAFIKGSNRGEPGIMNMTGIISEFYFAKTLKSATDTVAEVIPNEVTRIARSLRLSTDRMIKSNEKLAESNDRHEKAMRWLSVAVGAFAAVEAISTLLSWLTQIGVLDR